MLLIFDPAHGSNVAGKRSPILPDYLLKKYSNSPCIINKQFFEYKFSRHIISKLEKKLSDDERYLYNTERTVYEEEEPGLNERIKRLNKILKEYNNPKALLFSLHVDAYGMGEKWETPSGISFWVAKKSKKSKVYAKNLFQHMKKDLPEFNFRINRSLEDPVFEADFFVLKNSPIPSILLECGFQTNLKDVEKLLDPLIQEKIVDSLFSWCLTYLQNNTIDNQE